MVRIPAKVAKRIDEFVTKYMGILDIAGQRPRIKAYNDPDPFWLGRTTARLEIDDETGKLLDVTTILELQRILFKNENHLERVIAHEMVHHRDYVAEMSPEEKARIEALLAAGGDSEFSVAGDEEPSEETEEEISDEFTKASHGPSFFEGAARINAVMGPDYVTESADGWEPLKSEPRSPKLTMVIGVGAAVLLAAGAWIRYRKHSTEQRSAAMPPRSQTPIFSPSRTPRSNERGHYGKR